METVTVSREAYEYLIKEYNTNRSNNKYHSYPEIVESPKVDAARRKFRRSR